jgi:tetratricopeptide (TPR) repeat protein
MNASCWTVVTLVAIIVVLWWRSTSVSPLRLAQDAMNQGDYARAERLAAIAVDWAKTKGDFAAALDIFAIVKRFNGDTHSAEQFCRASLETRLEYLPPDDGDIGASMANLAQALLANGKVAEAKNLLVESLPITRKARGDDDPNVDAALISLSGACLLLGDLNEADKVADQLKARLSTDQSSTRRASADIHGAIAAVDSTLGRFHSAEREYRTALDLSAADWGIDHPFALTRKFQIGILLSVWADVIRNSSTLAEADKWTSEFVRQARIDLGLRNAMTVTGISMQSHVRRQQNKLDEAVTLAQEAVALIESVAPDGHYYRSDPHLNLAMALEAASEHADALLHAQKSFGILETAFGPNHYELAPALHTLGSIAVEQGRFAEAEKLLNRALELREQLGPMHPWRALTLRKLSNFYRKTGRDADADRVDQEIATIVAQVQR